MPYKTPEAKKQYMKKYLSRHDVAARRKDYNRQWCVANAGKRKTSEARRRLEQRGLCLIATARTRARKRGLDFDLDSHAKEIQARIDIGTCEITGLKFDLSPGRKFNSPSLDRIDPKQGYIYSNIRIVLNAVNAALGDWGESVLSQIIASWPSMQSCRNLPRNSSKRASKQSAK